MLEVTYPKLLSALKTLGLQPGDGVLVHSALQFLGKPLGGIEIYYRALAETCGLPEKGTLAVPAFNFGFARGEPYDPQTTPSQGMGSFSEFIRKLPGSRRTPHPMQSLAVFGALADDLAGRDTPSAFDPGSAFERMLELDFKLLLLGANIQAVSLVHYSEQRLPVPYRYWKSFSGSVARQEAGETHWETKTYKMFVRDLAVDPHLDLSPIQRTLQAESQWLQVNLNYGTLSVCRLVNFTNATARLLGTDPWALVSNRQEALSHYAQKQSASPEES